MKTTSLLLPAAMLLMTIFGCTQGPEKVAKKFIDAMDKRDFQGMKALSTDESQQMIDMMQGFAAKDTSKPKSSSQTIKSCEVKDSTALCTYCCDGDGKDATLHLKKTNKGWKVDMSKETLLGGKAAMDQLIKSSAEPDSLSASPGNVPQDTTSTVPGQ